MVIALVVIATFILSAGAEAIHAVRIMRMAPLVFGPGRIPNPLVWIAPLLRVCSFTALVWGLLTLFVQKPATLENADIPESKKKHVVLLVDVSPSMRLVDGGPDKLQSRAQRAKDVLQSFFDRVPIQQYKVSLIAFYDKAIPVVIDTNDMQVIINALSDLPMHFAFQGPKTDLFAGLQTTVEICKSWNPDSTVLIVVSDGDTVPATGMPRMPASIGGVLVCGVGDAVSGKFIDGRHSRQDVSTLRQVAARTGGVFHNGNADHLPTNLIQQLTRQESESRWADLTLREYALMAIVMGAVVLAGLPLLLHVAGSSWQPGVRSSPAP